MKKLLALVAVLALPVAAYAVGGIGTAQLGRELRTEAQIIPGYAVPNGTTDTTEGSSGVVEVITIGAATSTSSSEASIGALPYPARLIVRMLDADAGDTLACARVVLRGRNQFGVAVGETLLAVPEAATSVTRHAYEALTSVSASGCSPTEANDRLHIYMSAWVASDRILQSASDLVSVCQRDSALSNADWLCVKGSVCPVNQFSQTVDIANCTGLSAAENDMLLIRQRSAFGGGGSIPYSR